VFENESIYHLLSLNTKITANGMYVSPFSVANDGYIEINVSRENAGRQ